MLPVGLRVTIEGSTLLPCSEEAKGVLLPCSENPLASERDFSFIAPLSAACGGGGGGGGGGVTIHK